MAACAEDLHRISHIHGVLGSDLQPSAGFGKAFTRWLRITEILRHENVGKVFAQVAAVNLRALLLVIAVGEYP